MLFPNYRPIEDGMEWSYDMDKDFSDMVKVHICKQCGRYGILTRYVLDCSERGYESRSYHRNFTFIIGGKTPDGHWACDSCLRLGGMIDEKKNLERHIEYLKGRRKEMIDHIARSFDKEDIKEMLKKKNAKEEE